MSAGPPNTLGSPRMSQDWEWGKMRWGAEATLSVGRGDCKSSGRAVVFMRQIFQPFELTPQLGPVSCACAAGGRRATAAISSGSTATQQAHPRVVYRHIVDSFRAVGSKPFVRRRAGARPPAAPRSRDAQ